MLGRGCFHVHRAFSFTRHVLQCPRQNLRINSKAITVQLPSLCAMLLCSSRHWQLFHNKFISACGGKYFTVVSSVLQAAHETLDAFSREKRG